jgi:hypothetical protein
MVILNNAVFKFIGTVLFVSAVAGCTSFGTTKPNAPFTGTYPDKFNQLSYKNQLLAKEIGKLPELRDGISDSESRALSRLCVIYEENSKAFDDAFIKMFKIGKPEVRKYCSPLQALYWLIVDGKYDEAKLIIDDYDLGSLLTKAWYSDKNNYKIKSRWFRQESIKLYESCIDEDLKNQIEKFRKENIQGMDIRYIIDLSFKYPDKFQYKYNESKFEEYQSNRKNRWIDFKHVIDRLNAPILLDFYIDNNIYYVFDHQTCQNPSHTFNRKQGCCVCLAKFGKYALDRSGYKTFIRHLVGNRDQHGVLVVKDSETYYIVVDYTSYGQNRMSGPFKSIKEVDREISMVTGPKIYQRKSWE